MGSFGKPRAPCHSDPCRASARSTAVSFAPSRGGLRQRRPDCVYVGTLNYPANAGHRLVSLLHFCRPRELRPSVSRQSAGEDQLRFSWSGAAERGCGIALHAFRIPATSIVVPSNLHGEIA
jgi:hypothetical protein